MPDEAREVVFPHGVPIATLNGEPVPSRAAAAQKSSESKANGEVGQNVVSTKAEAGLYSEAEVIDKQAKQAQPLDSEENLLRGHSGGRPAKAN